MHISLKMNEVFNVGWFPEDEYDPCEEEQDIIMKTLRKQITTCEHTKPVLGSRRCRR